jgi:hypothetical protein
MAHQHSHVRLVYTLTPAAELDLRHRSDVDGMLLLTTCIGAPQQLHRNGGRGFIQPGRREA